jgi:hypothetical protein
VIAAGLCATYLRPASPRLARMRFPALLAVFASMGALLLLASPAPQIDVFTCQQEAARALLAGLNPYELDYPILYGPARTALYFAPESIREGRFTAFPYPPLTLLLGAGSWALAGDVRWVQLAALVFSGWAVSRLRSGENAELCAALLLFLPRTFFVLEQSWTEPTLLAAFLGALLLLQRGAGWPWLGAAFGLLAAAKHTSPLFLAPLLGLARGPVRWRAAALGAGLAAATFVPPLLANPRELFADLILFQARQPFRQDALSLLALWSRVSEVPRSAAALGFLAGGAILVWTLRRVDGVARTIAATAAAWLWFILLNKEAFCNYHWLAAGLLCAACALAHDSPREARQP